MHIHKMYGVLSALFLVLNLAVGLDANTAYSQQYPYSTDRQTREQYERERAREEGRREGQLEEQERNRDNYRNESNQYRGGDCNVQWDSCVRDCNTIRNSNQRMTCVGNCNNELERCNKR